MRHQYHEHRAMTGNFLWVRSCYGQALFLMLQVDWKAAFSLVQWFCQPYKSQNCAQLTGAVLNSKTQATLKPKMLGITALEVATSELTFVLNLSKGNSSCHLRALKLLQLLLLKTS